MATSTFDQLRTGLITHSAGECEAAAAALARELSPNTTLALHGDLGVGKTTFVRGIARGLGIRETITSPTFSLYSLYHAKPPQLPQPTPTPFTSPRQAPEKPPLTQPITLLHLDAYRIETSAQVETLLLEDFLQSPWCLAIEWPENIADWLPQNALHLTLSIATPHSHKIHLS